MPVNLSFAQSYCQLALFLLGALALVIPSGYSVGAVLLVIGGFYSYCYVLPQQPSSDRWVLLVFLLFALEGVFNAFYHEVDRATYYDKALRFLFAIPIYHFIRWTKPKTAAVWAGLATGGLLTAGVAIYQKFIEGIARAQGFTHPIQFGNLSMLIALLCTAGLGWAVEQSYLTQRKRWIVLLALGAIAGVLGSLLSGSRGGWIGLPFVLFVLYRTYHHYFSSRLKIGACATLLLIGVILFNTPQLGVKDRVYDAASDIQHYIDGNSVTSLGARFEMWQGAIQLIKQKPLLGWGQDDYQPAMAELVAQQKADPVVMLFNHAHNEILDRGAKHGLVGLVLLLALYIVPMWHFSPYLTHHLLSIRATAAAGTLMPVAYIDFGLSQAFLSHNSGIMTYSVWLMIWTALLRNQLEKVSPSAQNTSSAANVQ